MPEEKMRVQFRRALAWFEPYAGGILFFVLRSFLAVASIRVLGTLYLYHSHHFPEIWQYIPSALYYDLKALLLLALLFAPFICLFLRRKRWYAALVHAPMILLLMGHTGLTFYYSTVLDPLDKAVLLHSIDEVFLVWEEFGGLRPVHFLLLLSPLIYLGSGFWLSFSGVNKSKWMTPVLFLLYIIPFGYSTSLFPEHNAYPSERYYDLVNNKSLYLVSSLLEATGDRHRTMSLDHAVRRFQASREDREFTDPEYPLLHRVEEGSALAPFFELQDRPPNLVFVIVEGLGRAISGDNAHLHSFTPFLDSLAKESLYFSNFMSIGERTFSVLPASLGSLPHGPSGFINVKGKLPEHHTVQSLLRDNGYKGAFFYGGDAAYSSYDRFMEQQGVQRIYDRTNWKEGDQEKKGSKSSLNDNELFERGLRTLNSIGEGTPYLHTYLTISMHYPFQFEGQKAYIKRVEKRIEAQVENKKLRQQFKAYKPSLSSILFTDDALKSFFEGYADRPEYDNTIFLIFGDHRISQMRKRGPIDTYHVPLIIHSPLLQKAKSFRALNSQLDLPPAILSLLRANYDMDLPKKVPWLGSDLDTNSEFRSRKILPIMLNNGEVEHYLNRDLFLSYDKLYELRKGVKSVRKKDKTELRKVRKEFRADRIVGDHVVRSGHIIPPSSEVEEKSDVLFSVQGREGEFGPNTGFEMLLSDSLEADPAELRISVEVSFVGRFEELEDKQVPILVYVVKKPNGDKVFWNGIDVKEALVSGTEGGGVLRSQQRIGEEGARTLNKGQRIKIYFWNRRSLKRSFKYRVKKLQVKGVVE